MVVPPAIDTYHPTEIEVWNSTAAHAPGGFAQVTEEELRRWAAQIRAGATG